MMLRRLLFLILGILVIPFATTFAGIYGSVVGKVVDKDGKALPGTSVRVVGTKLGAITRPNGEYRIVKIQAGTYEIKFSRIGLETRTVSVTVVSDQKAEIPTITLTEEAIETDSVIVVAQRMVDKTQVGSVQVKTGKDLTRTARTTAVGVATLSAGVQGTGQGVQVRGSRTEHSQIRVDGVDQTDKVLGGIGGVTTVSTYATEEVKLTTGGMGAEYGNTLGGVVNVVSKTGNNERYEGFLLYRTDLSALNGSASNGLKLGGQGLTNVELGFGGPLPLLNDMTFYLSSVYRYLGTRIRGIEVIDPRGNNIGQLPNTRFWRRNVNLRFKYQFTDRIRLEFGGDYSVATNENNNTAGTNWAWLYANDFGVIDGVSNGVEERRAKQIIANRTIANGRLKMNHTLSGGNSFYEVSLVWNQDRTEIARPSSFDGAGLFSPIDTYTPVDDVRLSVSQGQPVNIEGSDFVIDYYASVDAPSETEDGFLAADRPSINPLTGYHENGNNTTGTDNAYGVQGIFITHGNQGFEYRKTDFIELAGSYTSLFKAGEFEHAFKAGFDFKRYKIGRHSNSNPWSSEAFFDVYTDEDGGNLYTDDPELKDITSKPYEPLEGAFYVQDQVEFKQMVLTAGVRVDISDPSASVRTRLTPFVSIRDLIDNPDLFEDVSIKTQVSPRFSVAYPLNEAEDALLRLNYGVFFQRPTYQRLYDGFNIDQLRGSQLVGNPDLEAQTTKSYEMQYSSQLTDHLAFTVSAYYKDIFNLTGVSYVPASPTPYTIVTLGEYGNSKGLEFQLRKRVHNNYGFELNYTLATARGTASNTTSNLATATAGISQYAEERAFPLEDYYLSYDIRHNLNAQANFEWGDNEGPTIGGLRVLEHTSVNFTGTYRTGTPYTRLGRRGEQIGDFNAERQPSRWNIDSRIERIVPLKDLFGESLGDARLAISLDVYNVLNRTEPLAVFARTGDPDNDGVSLDRSKGDFSATNWFKEADEALPATYSANQYDTFGNRLYNEKADINGDDVVTQAEKLEAYRAYVHDAMARQANYQNPREIVLGLRLFF